MVPILVLLTFVLFVMVDYFLGRKEEQVTLPLHKPLTGRLPVPLPQPIYVDGYRMQEAFYFHQGHSWAMAESTDTVRVGLDDFAQRLIGRIDGIDLPQVGEIVRQGRCGWTIRRNGQRVAMLSPVSGRVIDVNADLLASPVLVKGDPYQAGWLFAVETDDLISNLNNLLRGTLARRWMEEEAARLRLRLSSEIGITMQDGGMPAEDLLLYLDAQQWEMITREFFRAGR